MLAPGAILRVAYLRNRCAARARHGKVSQGPHVSRNGRSFNYFPTYSIGLRSATPGSPTPGIRMESAVIANGSSRKRRRTTALTGLRRIAHVYPHECRMRLRYIHIEGSRCCDASISDYQYIKYLRGERGHRAVHARLVALAQRLRCQPPIGKTSRMSIRIRPGRRALPSCWWCCDTKLQSCVATLAGRSPPGRIERCSPR